MNLIEYFAVIDEDGLRGGPFKTLEDATGFLRKFALNRGYTHEQSDQFFLHESAVVKMETKNGKVAIFHLSWQAREESSSQGLPTEMREALPEMVMAKAPLRRKPK
jgi:hypothetical protein